MKKILFILVLLISISSFAQRRRVYVEKQQEITLNAMNLIVFKWLDASYEKILNEESSVGVSFLTKIGNKHDDIDLQLRDYSITPYYRQYFSPYHASGFFMEAFGMYNVGERKDWDNDETIHQREKVIYKDVAFGIGVGEKFLSRRGFVGVVYAGLGRNMFDKFAPEVVTRAGISFGFRF